MTARGTAPRNPDRDRVRVAALVGWLQGFSSSVWLLACLDVDGRVLVGSETCAEYDEVVGELARLVSAGAPEIGGAQMADEDERPLR